MTHPKKPSIVYRVNHKDHSGQNGYSFYGSRLAAEKLQARLNRINKTNDKVDFFEFQIKRKDFIRLLNQIATHADNG